MARLLTVLFLSLIVVAFSRSEALAGYFVNSFAGSPLATYEFGDVNQSTASGATSETTYINGGGATYSAEGSAAVDLSTGQLHALAQLNYGFTGAGGADCPGCDSPFPFGNASFGDTLTFLGSFTGQTVTVTMTVDGTYTTNCLGCVGLGSATAQLLILPAGTIDANSGNELGLFPSNPTPTESADLNPSATSATPEPVSGTITETVMLNGVDPQFDIAADLDIFGAITCSAANLSSCVGESFDANFLDTADISFNAPADVTVLSASGVFPDTIPAPEPASLTILGSGLLGLAVIRRRKRAART